MFLMFNICTIPQTEFDTLNKTTQTIEGFKIQYMHFPYSSDHLVFSSILGTNPSYNFNFELHNTLPKQLLV